ncbi:YfbU family protein [Pantoea cypripedii]|uniref:YfbU family protein n=1 Tax=Pantoea cypripedii TaxID=55209 RepID=A0A1X1ET01_PANCY|nr:YfbU family protein [Pantoea cypripedii]MBP2197210.1 uncharacterized protein YfbU (UPF0304 family) [Pantoea cypripedii]ORM93139.1 hypothetical protein HA50_07185 [Pantoea cypripedii]
MSLTQAEKLQILLLCDIHKALGIQNSLDVNFIKEAVETNNLWALEWEYDSLSSNADNPTEVKHVCDVLVMYDILKFTYERLSSTEQALLAKEVPGFSPENSLTFPGFNSKAESRLISIAEMLVRMGRFNRQEVSKKSDYPTYESSERMLQVFTPSREDFNIGRGITYSALRDTLLAGKFISNQ